MNIIQKPVNSSNYTKQSTKKVGFVLHWIVGEVESADATFANSAKQVSAHYGIGSNGEVHQYVADEYIAWHAGNWEANTKYIGIEHAGGQDLGGGNRKKPTEQCHLTSIELITELCRKHGISQLIRGQNIFKHSEIKATQCCGSLDIDRITNAVNNNFNNNNNMSNLEQQKKIATDFLTNPAYQGMPFNDGNQYGYLRSIVHNKVEEGGQNPAEALKQFGFRSIDLHNSLNSQIQDLQNQRANLETQLQNTNLEKQSLTNQVNSLNSQLSTTNQTNKELQNELVEVRRQVLFLSNENQDLKNQLANQKPSVDIDVNIYIEQIRELEEKLSTTGVENLQLKKQINLLNSNKFSLDKLITGIVSGKNYLANFSFISFLTGLSSYLSDLTQIANPEIASGLTFATGAIAMILIFVKNKKPKEGIKEVKEESKKIQL